MLSVRNHYSDNAFEDVTTRILSISLVETAPCVLESKKWIFWDHNFKNLAVGMVIASNNGTEWNYDSKLFVCIFSGMFTHTDEYGFKVASTASWMSRDTDLLSL